MSNSASNSATPKSRKRLKHDHLIYITHNASNKTRPPCCSFETTSTSPLSFLQGTSSSHSTVIHTRCLPVIIIHAFKPTRFKSEQQWSWRPCVAVARRPTSIDCLRHVFNWSNRSLAITNALTVDQVIQNGLPLPSALSFALNVPVDTEVLVFRYVARTRAMSNLVIRVYLMNSCISFVAVFKCEKSNNGSLVS